MEEIKRDVDELNELAEKITGTNPKATTTAEVLNYIEQNYTSGGGSSSDSGIVILEENKNHELNLTPNTYSENKIYMLKKRVTDTENEKQYDYVMYNGIGFNYSENVYDIYFADNDFYTTSNLDGKFQKGE